MKRFSHLPGRALWLPLIIAGVALGNVSVVSAKVTPAVSVIVPENSTPSDLESVMVVGGSAARGYLDPNQNSYIERAFTTMSEKTNTGFVYHDRAIPGEKVVQVTANTFTSWLQADEPSVVVISWGLLNDVHAATPLQQVKNTIHNEIEESLAAKAAVLVVTPPPVPSSAITLHKKFVTYITAEQALVTSLQQPNLYWIDLNQDMTNYLTDHDLPLSSYSANTAHPNEKGHELAGTLLYQKMKSLFGDTSPYFRTSFAGNTRRTTVNKTTAVRQL